MWLLALVILVTVVVLLGAWAGRRQPPPPVSPGPPYFHRAPESRGTPWGSTHG